MNEISIQVSINVDRHVMHTFAAHLVRSCEDYKRGLPDTQPLPYKVKILT